MAAALLLISIVSYGQQTIAFASDTQAPMWVERIALPANHNKQAPDNKHFLHIVCILKAPLNVP